MREAKTVTEVTTYIKRMFSQDSHLKSVLIKGEISNCKYHSSGHIYFTLKDSASAINAVMFRGNRMYGLDFTLEDGQKVIIAGEINIYEKDGKYQLYSKNVMLDGVGRLYEELEKQKKRFEAEGLFDEKHKKRVPLFSARIGVVTAATGAAIQDIITTARRRNPYVQLILYPAKVQGEGAAETIARGIKRLEKENVDIIIVGRGGGSIEDLWAFNEEVVVRAIYDCSIPIISAVGHEVDHPVSDYVADLRAATPTAAAEMAVPHLDSILAELEGMETGITYHIKEKIRFLKAVLEKFELKIIKESPGYKLRQYAQRVDEVEDKLKHIIEKRIGDYRTRLATYNMNLMMERKLFIYKNRLEAQKVKLFHKMKMKYEEKNRKFLVLAERLDGYSPMKRLTGGYSYMENEQGENIRSVAKLQVNEKLRVTLSDGKIKVEVKEIK